MSWYNDPSLMGMLGGLGSGLLSAGVGGQPIASRGQALAAIPGMAMQGMQQGLLQDRMRRQWQREDQRDVLWQQAFGGGAGQGAAGGVAPPGAGAPGAPQPALSPQAEALRGAVPQGLLPLLGALGPEQGTALISRMMAKQPQQHVVGPGAALVGSQGNVLFQAPPASKLLSPEEFAQQAALRRAGATSMSVRLPPMENAFAQTTGQGLGKEALDLSAAGAKAADTLRNLQRFDQALARFPTGAAANARLTIGQWAQQLGLPDEMLPQGVNRDATASAEEMRAITGEMLRGAIGPGGFPANNFSNADREMLEKSFANIGNTPEGNRQIITNMRAAAQRNLEVAQAWRDWMMRHGNTAESYMAFQQQVLPQIRERNIIAPPQQQARKTPPPSTGAQDQARRTQAEQVIAQLRQQHPEWSNEQLVAAARRLVWGQ